MKMDVAKEECVGRTLARQLGKARRDQLQSSLLAKDVKTLTQWLRRDVLELAGLCLDLTRFHGHRWTLGFRPRLFRALR